MAIRFRTCCSSSSGNCLHLEAEGVAVLIDCGFGSQRAFEQVLEEYSIDAVLVSHAHSDHVNYSALRVLARRGITLHAEERVMEQLLAWPNADRWRQGLRYETFRCGESPRVAGLQVQPLQVPHAPGFDNFAFGILAGGRRLLTCTDSYDASRLAPELEQADLIYLESNHDLELLRLFPNHASRYHLSNVKAGQALGQSLSHLYKKPQAIMLGHLSTQRNRPELALETVRLEIARAEAALTMPLLAAPAFEPSQWIEVA